MRTTQRALRPTPPPQGLLDGIALFNSRQFYLCHEALERLWMKEQETDRLLYQGILQIAVACHHLIRWNYDGAMRLLERGCQKLERFDQECRGIDVADLLRQARALQAAIARRGPSGLPGFDVRMLPSVHLVGKRV
ncbi:MAG: DUF309 domain-containing protein [Chloroflexi bacterium]|nr:DUF309 domain-containing protein [Chloroflexota bacterium]